MHNKNGIDTANEQLALMPNIIMGWRNILADWRINGLIAF